METGQHRGKKKKKGGETKKRRREFVGMSVHVGVCIPERSKDIHRRFLKERPRIKRYEKKSILKYEMFRNRSPHHAPNKLFSALGTL